MTLKGGDPKSMFIEDMYSNYDKVRVHDYYNKASGIFNMILSNVLILLLFICLSICCVFVLLSALAKFDSSNWAKFAWLMMMLGTFGYGAHKLDDL